MQCYKIKWIVQNGIGRWVACNKCNFCLSKRRFEWSFRLTQEEQRSQSAHFLTLTYNDLHIPRIWEWDNVVGTSLEKQDIYLFHKSLKQFQRRTLGKALYERWKIRYYTVGEYGSLFGRPHYHSIIFNLHPTTIQYLENGMMVLNKKTGKEELRHLWGKGHLYFGTVTQASVAYVCKYVIDQEPNVFPKDLEEYAGTLPTKPFATMSRNPGIGHGYLLDNEEWHRPGYTFDQSLWRMYTQIGGFKNALPRYYRDRIFKYPKPPKFDLFEDLYKVDTNHNEPWTEEILNTQFEEHFNELANQFEKQYIQEIERLEKLHPDPEMYYRERLKQAYDRIRIKSLKLNTL